MKKIVEGSRRICENSFSPAAIKATIKRFGMCDGSHLSEGHSCTSKESRENKGRESVSNLPSGLRDLQIDRTRRFELVLHVLSQLIVGHTIAQPQREQQAVNPFQKQFGVGASTRRTAGD